MGIKVSLEDAITTDEVIELYAANQWSSASKPVQLMLTADGDAVSFYEALDFSRAGRTVPMWIYGGGDH